jgi:hypothetical protein
MIHLPPRRRGSPVRHRSSGGRCLGWLETLESRIALSNGLVGVPAEFIAPPVHDFAVTSVPQDPNNTGVVPSTTVTAVGNVENPAGGAISNIHTALEIHAFENGTDIGSVSWNVTAGPGTITGPKYFGQDPAAANRALFSLPFTLLTNSQSVQNVTFQVVAVGFGTRTVVLQSNTNQNLMGTFVVKEVPSVSMISPIPSPRIFPVESVDVTFSSAIVPTTFTTAALTLTRNGVVVPLTSPPVTFATTDDTTFTIGGLANDTAALGSYVLTVDATGVKNQFGTSGVGSLSESFVVESPNAPPMIAHISPISSPRTEPVSSVGVTFTKAIDPKTFTTAALTLTRDGVPVPLDPNVVTFTTSDNVTFTIGGLTSSTTTPGSYGLTINAAAVTDLAGHPGSGTQSVDFLVQAPVVDTGPQVVGLFRFGFHSQPPLLVLTFSSQLDPARAVNPKNYHVFAAGRDGRLGTADDIQVPLMSGFYNSANKTVTLVMAKPLSVSRRYRIVVRGTGPTPITDLNGVALDGKANGVPGSDFTTTFGREILVVSPPSTTTASNKNPAHASGKGRYRSFQLGPS